MKSLGDAASNVARDAQDRVESEPGYDSLLDKWKFMLALARDKPPISGGAFKAAFFILDSYDRRRNVYECTYSQIAKGAGIDRSTAIRAVKALNARGWFQYIPGERNGRKVTRFYPQWLQHRSKRQSVSGFAENGGRCTAFLQEQAKTGHDDA